MNIALNLNLEQGQEPGNISADLLPLESVFCEEGSRLQVNYGLVSAVYPRKDHLEHVLARQALSDHLSTCEICRKYYQRFDQTQPT